MKTGTVLAICLAVLLFVGVVVTLTLEGAAVECEVCLEFDGEEVCRLGRGETEEDALAAAQESTCGGNASGMAELIACRGQAPTRTQCGV